MGEVYRYSSKFRDGLTDRMNTLSVGPSLATVEHALRPAFDRQHISSSDILHIHKVPGLLAVAVDNERCAVDQMR